MPALLDCNVSCRALNVGAVAILLGCVGPSLTFGQGRPSVASFVLEIDGSTIDARITEVPRGASQEQLRTWIETAARAVSHYYGRFPVERVRIDIRPTRNGHGVHGRTFSGRRIVMGLGTDVTEADLNDDWVLTHEMLHLAFPDLDESHLWMNEGLSVYLEPIARVRIGTLKPERIWRDMAQMMPNGLPRPGDRGLDRSHTWGRTYWGGCIFWLRADVRIRQQTHNQRALDDALKAILDAGGDGSANWPISRVLDVGDRATGTAVLHQLYDEIARQPGNIDLPALWKSLGVRYEHRQVTFDDNAPLAELRRAITSDRSPMPATRVGDLPTPMP